MWAVAASIYELLALCGLLQTLCMMYRRYVGCYIVYSCCSGVVWAVISSMWDVVASMYDAQALCGLLYPLTLILTMMKVECRNRNPNPTTVAATRLKEGALRLL